MALLLRQQFDLLAFTVCLETAGREVAVRCALEGSSGDALEVVREWRCPAEQLGIPDRLERQRALGPGYDFQLPTYLLDELAEALTAGNLDTSRGLWLHLRRPYGYLNLVPWERLLQARLGLPILRVPEFLADPPRQNSARLNVALCTSTPQDEERFLAVRHIDAIIQGILSLQTRRITIDLFVDSGLWPQMRSAPFAGLTQVQLHDPSEAQTYAPTASFSTTTSNRLQNPWLLWMRDQLQGRSIDMLHWLAHGYLSHDRGALALAESPLADLDRGVSGFVGPTELAAFLTQVGAWSVAFSSPERNYSEMGLRLLTDNIAQTRPGPVVHHEIVPDLNYQAIQQTYHFLFDPATPPPQSPAIICYCHPARVTPDLNYSSGPVLAAGRSGQSANRTPRGALEAFRPPDPLATLYATNDEVPAWVAAAQRHIEKRSLELDKQVVDESSTKLQEEAATVSTTLQELQQIVAEVAQNPNQGSES